MTPSHSGLVPTKSAKLFLLTVCTVASASIILARAAFQISFLDAQAFGWLSLFLLLSVAASFITEIKSVGCKESEGRHSLNYTFVFLSAMLYGAWPSAIIACVYAAVAARRESLRRLVFEASAASVSTYVAVQLFHLSARALGNAGQALAADAAGLSILIIPVLALAVSQYAVRESLRRAFAAARGVSLQRFSPSVLVWELMSQMASATASALFYLTWQGYGLTYVFIGALILAHAYLLSHFHEERLEDVRRAESEKMRHLQEIADLHMNTIESLAIAIDAKDQTTHGHVLRTQVYALELGKILGVSRAEMEALRAGALLHDIGKLAVPEYILNKPGKLTAAEFEKMKVHTVVGGDIIKRVNFPYPVEDIVRFHHEKWDGGGYPKGLKGEQIPLVARIISVVDFYDATRCDRPYRLGMKREESLALLSRMSGKSFDPRVVESFVANVDSFDRLIAAQDMREQVQSEGTAEMTDARPDAGLAADAPASSDGASAFRTIAEAHREVFALHEIAQTIGASLNLQDTATLVASKLRAIVPFETCVIYLVDEKTGEAYAAHAAGEHAEVFGRRRLNVGGGITGWVIANARSMCSTSPELDLAGLPAEVAGRVQGVLVSPLVREDGAFGAITLYSSGRSSYTNEQVRLLESVAHHASSALNNALIHERTKESALTDPLTGLPNSRALHLMLEQRLAECQRNKREPLAVLSLDFDGFKDVNGAYGHGVGDRVLAASAEVVKKQLRQMDVLARFGGDEFVAVMPTASAEVAARVAERIRSAVSSHKFHVRTGHTTQLSLSIGVASYPEDGDTPEQLLVAAERRMRREKNGRKLTPENSQAGTVASIEAFR